MGGNANPSSVSNIIDYVTISAMGNAQDFGDLTLQEQKLVLVLQQLVVFLLVLVSAKTNV